MSGHNRGGCGRGFCCGVLVTALLSSVVAMNAQTARAMILGRCILIHYRGKASKHERTLLAFGSDQE